MPDRLYHPRHHPPTVGDRISAHWAELILAGAGIFRGLLGIASEWIPQISRALDRIPAFFGILVPVSLIVGGVIWISSIVNRFKTLNRFYYTLRTGLLLSVLGWLSFFTSAILFHPTRVFTWGATLTAAIATCGLYLLTFVNERTIRQGETKA